MKPEITKKLFKPFKHKLTMVIAGVILTLTAIVPFSMCKAESGRIHTGIYVNGIDAGNLTKGELTDILNKRFQDEVKKTMLTLKYKDSMIKLAFSDLDVKYDIEKVASQTYSYELSENVLEKLFENIVSKNRDVRFEVPVEYNSDKLKENLRFFEENKLHKIKEAELTFKDEEVRLRSGITGETIDYAKLIAEVKTAIEALESSSIEIPIIETRPKKIDIDEIYSKISREPADAFVKIEDNKAVVVPEIKGRSIDKAVLSTIVSKLESTEGTEKVLPVVFVLPNRSAQEINERIFKDVLSTFSTQFSTDTQNNKNRGENIRIAVEKINGKLLAPGEIFSFNDVVGERTEEAGYKEANAYIGGKVVPSAGGGICQVSTTLYNAVLPLGLGIVERTNHMFTVAYVPLGMDAAVAYGQVDLKFKNTTNWPIKIQGWVTKDNKIHFSITGTNEGSGKTVEYYSKTLKTTDFKIKYVDDPSLEEGKTVVKQKGSKGFVVDTYRVVKKDGKIISDNKMYTSRYNPLDEEILRGTKKARTPETPDQ